MSSFSLHKGGEFVIEKIISFFKKGGENLGMTSSLNSILDHKKINVSMSDYQNVLDNIRHYQGDYGKVEYISSNGIKKQRDFHSINLSKTLARKLAKLVFNEGVTISIENNDDVSKFVNEQLEHNDFRSRFSEELESAYALNGLVIKPKFDAENGKIILNYVKADSFFPLKWTGNKVHEAAFKYQTVVKNSKENEYYTLIEFHEWEKGVYIVSNELYYSKEKDKLGTKIPLSALEKYKDLKPRQHMVNVKRPLFTYVKLAGKNNRNIYSPMSLSIIDNSKKQIIDFNEKYDQFMWEIKQSKRRLLASEEFFRGELNERTGQFRSTFDDESTAFKKLRTDDPYIKEFSPQLRSEEYIETLNFILRVIELQCGFSSGTFSFDGQSVKTATEVVAENSETYATREENTKLVEQALKQVIHNMVDLARLYGVLNDKSDYSITIDFDDGVFQSKNDQLEYYSKAAQLRLIPRYRAMMRMHGLDKKTALIYLQEIEKEERGVDPGEVEHQREVELFGSEE